MIPGTHFLQQQDRTDLGGAADECRLLIEYERIQDSKELLWYVLIKTSQKTVLLAQRCEVMNETVAVTHIKIHVLA